jgi:hypothetical protein
MSCAPAITQLTNKTATSIPIERIALPSCHQIAVSALYRTPIEPRNGNDVTHGAPGDSSYSGSTKIRWGNGNAVCVRLNTSKAVRLLPGAVLF